MKNTSPHQLNRKPAADLAADLAADHETRYNDVARAANGCHRVLADEEIEDILRTLQNRPVTAERVLRIMERKCYGREMKWYELDAAQRHPNELFIED